MLTGHRKTLLASMKRSQLDDAEDPTEWVVPGELTKGHRKLGKKKAKPYFTPLVPLVQRIIKGLPRDSDFVFPGRGSDHLDPGTPLVNKLIKRGAPSDLTYHALRHTVATWVAATGPVESREARAAVVLNHSGPRTVTADYIHVAANKRGLLQSWADHIEKLVRPAEGVALLR
jgi:integrase